MPETVTTSTEDTTVVVEQASTTVVVESTDERVEVATDPIIQIVTVGTQGPRGVDGLDGTTLHAELTDTDTDGHPASAITNVPAGNIVATTVQAAINELDLDKVTAEYVDSVVVEVIDAIFDYRGDVDAIATTNVTRSGLQTIDGVSLQVGDLILLTAQTDGSQNGVYTVASGAWSRWTEANESAELEIGFTVRVNNTSSAHNTQFWILLTDDVVVDVTTQLWGNVVNLAPILVTLITALPAFVDQMEAFFVTFSAQFKGGSGSPEGVTAGSPGAIYFNTLGGSETSLYTKESGTGTTGWKPMANVPKREAFSIAMAVALG